jgi:sulfur carrier protein ThiS
MSRCSGEELLLRLELGHALHSHAEALKSINCDEHPLLRERDAHINTLLGQVDMMREVVSSREGLLGGLVTGRVQDLQEQLARAEAELAVLKSSNAVKGSTHEQHLASILRSALPDHDVVQTGRSAHEADIHVQKPDGSILMVECKAKDRISKLDVDKFYADIKSVSTTARVTGAMFVSCTTQSIPHKGSMRLEFRGDVPVIFCGFDTIQDMDARLPALAILLSDLAGCLSRNQADEIETARLKLKPLLKMLERSSKRVVAIREEQLVPLAKAVGDLESDLHKMAQAVGEVIKNM